MDSDKSIDILTTLLERAPILYYGSPENIEFKKWKRDTEVALENIFKGKDHRARFMNVPFEFSGFGDNNKTFEKKIFISGLNEACSLIQSAIDEVKLFSPISTKVPVAIHKDLAIIFNRFHFIAKQIESRYCNRETLKINDEYDVQDLLHSLLKTFYDDIRTEEYTPSYAGGAVRMDFLIKKIGVVVETKMARSSLSEKQLGEELIIDIAKYEKHPDCNIIFCFVYDPKQLIKNPRGIESDLKRERPLKVEVYIRPL